MELAKPEYAGHGVIAERGGWLLLARRVGFLRKLR